MIKLLDIKKKSQQDNNIYPNILLKIIEVAGLNGYL
jgi:hypothetical protein